MSRLSKYIGSQFAKPRGLAGKICCYFMNRINGKMYDSILDRLSSEQNVLEIGYGNGFLISKMYNKLHAKINGIDISEDMKTLATKKNEVGIRNGDIKLSLGDCCDLAFVDEQFDAVVTVNTIYFWEDTIKGLKEIRRVLKTEGTFYSAVYSKQWMSKSETLNEGKKMFEKDEYIAMAREAGFSETEIIDIKKNTTFIVAYRK